MVTRITARPQVAGFDFLVAVVVLALLACASSQRQLTTALPAPPPPLVFRISPGHTPEQSSVRLEAAGLVPGSTLSIGFGKSRSDFQVIDRARVDAGGLIKLHVSVPAWARHGEEYVMVVQTDADVTIAVSDPIVIAPTGASLTLSGRYTDHAPRCPALRTASGKVYQLELPVPVRFAAGTELEVTGTIAAAGVCEDITTLTVEKLTVRSRPPINGNRKPRS